MPGEASGVEVADLGDENQGFEYGELIIGNLNQMREEVNIWRNKHAIHAYTHSPMTGSGSMQL